LFFLSDDGDLWEEKCKMKLATFNVCWLGNERFAKMTNLKEREMDDWVSIARVVAKLDADVIVFQEIVNLEELRNVLILANGFTGRKYQMRDQQNQVLGTGKSKEQKVVIAYDEQQYELVAASPIFGGEGRIPFGVRVRSVTDVAQILVVGVHFKSGQPYFDDKTSADKRMHQCQHLADWIAGKKAELNPVFPQPAPDERVAILGDFNAIFELEPDQPQEWKLVVDSLDPLRQEHMKEWWWEKPLADPVGGDRTTAYLDHLLIDFVMLSPALKTRITQKPTIYAYDQDLSITSQSVNGVEYRVSDHRPVHVELDVLIHLPQPKEGEHHA
jgi:endonuclease/exonuclease/phosphatase family metal-dependent hydrolase